MPTTPSSLQVVKEVELTTIGDQAPTPVVGSIEVFANQNDILYKKTSSGTVVPLINGVTSIDGLAGIIPTGTSIIPVSGSLETALPIQAQVAGTSKVYALTDLDKMWPRTNSGTPMTDTLPVGTAAVNGMRIYIANDDVTATLTLTAGAGQAFVGATGGVGATTFVIKAARRTEFVWNNTGGFWRIGINNNNLTKGKVGTTFTLGNFPIISSNTDGSEIDDSGINVATVSSKAPSASPTFTGTVTVPTPVNPTDASTKSYVDAVAQGLTVKTSVGSATVGTETFTVVSGSITQITGTTVDGQSPAVNDRILIKDAPAATGTGSANSTQPGNGIYIVTSNTTNLFVSRVADMATTNGPAGAFTFVEAGTVNGSAGYVVSTPSTNTGFTYGTNNIKWTQFSGAGEITVDATLTKTGNQLSRPAISGDITINTGSNTAALTNIPNATTAAGDVLFTNIAAPASPAAGKTMQYVDSTSKNMASKNDAGVVNHGVQTKTATANQFVTAIADDGTVTQRQPVVADVTGAAATATTISTTAPLTGGGDLSANRTLAISPATTTTAGSMSAADRVTLSNFWYDVTNYGVSISNSGAANVAAMNTLIQTTAPAGAVIYFPNTGANYPMAGTITVTKNYQQFWGDGMRASVIFSANTTVDLFFLTDGVRNITFQDIGFWSTATATAGSAINCGTVTGGGNAQINIYRCGLEGFGGNWFNGVMYNGTLAGLLCNLEDCNFNAFTHYGIGIVGNTAPSTVSANIISNTTLNGNINGTTGATAGIFVRQCGALQIVNSDVIQCTNNLLINPQAAGEIIASIYANNSYFDSSYGSCVLVNGSGPVVRCKFVSCSFTVSGGANNYSAFEVNSTAANAPAGIDLLNCSIQNTFGNSGTSNGMLLTTIADIKIEGNNISGFTNGIQVTPVAGGVTRLNILGNTIGPAGGIKGNATGILLNAGVTPYGMIQIVDNVFPATTPYGAANTVNITDNSTLGAGTASTGSKSIANNNGTIVSSPIANYGVVFPATTITNCDSRGGVFFPAGARPSSGSIDVFLTNAATIQTFGPIKLLFGTTNSNADTLILTSPAFTAGTAVLGSGHVHIDWELVSTTKMVASMTFFNGNNAATGIAAGALRFELGTASPGITVNGAVNNWLGVYAASTINAIVTVSSIKYAVQSQ